VSAATKPKPLRSVWIVTEVEVEPDTLRDAGWHHESECDAGGFNDAEEGMAWLPATDVGALAAAVASLHRQAHPSSPSAAVCPEEPCRSLTLDQLRMVPE
jgi:hypothetical protein